MDNSWIPTCMKKDLIIIFHQRNILGKKSFSTEICILILFGFFKTWIFTFENWCFQTFEFPPPRLQCIYWNFFLHQRNVQKHFQFDEAEHKGYLWGEMYNLYKKKLNMVIKILFYCFFLTFSLTSIDFFQNCKQVGLNSKSPSEYWCSFTIFQPKGISIQKFNLFFGISIVRTFCFDNLQIY